MSAGIILYTFCLFIFIDELNTYQQLISMGFEDDISLSAAKKYKNMNEATSFILDQETSTKSAATTYQEKINKMFRIFESQNDVYDDIYDMIWKEYLHDGGNNQFIIDHSECMTSFDVNKEYINYDGICDFAHLLNKITDSHGRNIKLLTEDDNGVAVQSIEQDTDHIHGTWSELSVLQTNIISFGLISTSTSIF